MKLKFLFVVITSVIIFNAFATASTSVQNKCCVFDNTSGACKCYALYNQSCDHCTATSDCSDCKDSDWGPSGTQGYEAKTSAICELNQCMKFTTYRCAVGYYGSTTDGASGCTRCPASGGVYGTTATAGSTVITSCYIPSGSPLSDSGGTFEYTENCYYKN